MRQLRIATIALAAAFVAAAAQAEITIGVSLGTTGPGASLGVPYKNAFQLVPKTLGGEPVRYIVLDDESKPDSAAKNARKFVTEDKVDALMGSTGVPSASAMAQVAAESKTPLIALTPLPPLAPDRQQLDLHRAAADRADDERGRAAHEGQGREDGGLHRLLRQLGRPGLQRDHLARPRQRLQGRHQRALRRAPTPASPGRCSR